MLEDDELLRMCNDMEEKGYFDRCYFYIWDEPKTPEHYEQIAKESAHIPVSYTDLVYNRWYAYGLLARIALHEGTFRKYHDELELQSSADQFLEKAVNACEKIMANTTDFGIYTDGGIDAYGNMFISNNLSKCKEILLFKDFS